MNFLPQQSKPVSRKPILSKQDINGILPSGCSTWDGIKCAGIIVGCSVACGMGALIWSPPCIACMGSAYHTCKDCF